MLGCELRDPAYEPGPDQGCRIRRRPILNHPTDHPAACGVDKPLELVEVVLDLGAKRPGTDQADEQRRLVVGRSQIDLA